MHKIVFRTLLPLATLSFATVASADQMIQNQDFGVGAGTLDHWTRSGSITDNNGTTSHDFAFASSQKCHSTRFSASLNVENFSNTTFSSELLQMITPTVGGSVTELQTWVFSYNQNLEAKLLYSDNTSSILTKKFSKGQQEANDPDGGWELWNLMGLLNPAKTLVGIRFSAESGGFNPGDNIFIDDVSIKGVQAVPEPATMFAMASGAAVLMRRRRKAR